MVIRTARTYLKAAPLALLILAFVAAYFAEPPSRLDLAQIVLREAPPAPIEIQSLEEKPTEVETKAPDPLNDLAPEALSSDPSLLDTGFGAGYGEGGPAVGGNGEASRLVGERTSIDRPARLLSRAPLDYPPEARNRGVSGEIILKVRIGASGSIEDARIERAIPAGVFEAAALRSVRSWRFEPAFVKGKAVAAWVTQKIRFEMN
jgi:TonB family protein